MKTQKAVPVIRNHEEYFVSADGECHYGLTSPQAGAKWSGQIAIPMRGTRVYVRFNNFGPGVVRGYFVEHGWLGVYVEPDAPPEWWIEQQYREGKVRQCCMAFGAEINSIEKEPAA